MLFVNAIIEDVRSIHAVYIRYTLNQSTEWVSLSAVFSFKTRLIKHLRTPNYDYSLLFVCLLEFDHPTRGYFTHMEMLFRI